MAFKVYANDRPQWATRAWAFSEAEVEAALLLNASPSSASETVLRLARRIEKDRADFQQRLRILATMCEYLDEDDVQCGQPLDALSGTPMLDGPDKGRPRHNACAEHRNVADWLRY